MTTHVITHSELLLHACGGATKTKSLMRIDAGLITRPLKNGRINIWPISEVEIMDRAVITGKTDDELREIVTLLESERNSSDPFSHPRLSQLRAMVAAARARTAEADLLAAGQLEREGASSGR